MFGNIVGVEGNYILVNLQIDLDKVQNLVNMYVIMEDEKSKLVGEITDIKDKIAYINLLGEFVNEKFIFGVRNKPAFSAVVKLISKEKVSLIIGTNDYKENKDLYIGESVNYDGVKVSVGINSFFSNHFAIFGSTGSGKSCGVARIFQNLFQKKTSIPYRSSIFIFDAYGEYHNAFKNIHEVSPNISFKAYTTNLGMKDGNMLQIPLWLLSVDDIALLLGADKSSMLPIIEKALKLISVFARDEESVIKTKNDIIARAILDILTSGRSSTQIRDQIISILSNYNTRDLNLDTQVFQPGYTRPLKQCLLIDASGKIREIELITTFIQTFIEDLTELHLPDGTFKYTLDDLEKAFDFALISEGVLNSEKIYDESNILKVRLHSLVTGDYRNYFDYPEYISRDDYIKKLITTSDGKKAQIINFNITYVDDRLAKNITKIYSKMLFDYAKNLEVKASLPIHIVLEEAHRYVQNDNDINLLGYNIFERIAKEGRKYGVLLGLISQRPSELSETCLSQCNNFLIFKMLQPHDIDYIRAIVPNITDEVIRRIKILQPGMCIGFGLAFKLPILIKLDLPDPLPDSNSCNIEKLWFVDKK